MSDDGGVTPSQETAHASPTEVTPELGKGALDTWRPSRPYGEETTLPQEHDHLCKHFFSRMLIIDTFDLGQRPRHRPYPVIVIVMNTSLFPLPSPPSPHTAVLLPA